MERTAIFPGSFDPFTRGHAALVDEALNLFDRVVIGIGNNTAKTGLLTVANRKRLIDDMKSVTLNDMDGEIAELMYKTIRKLEAMTDAEFEELYIMPDGMMDD